MHHPTLPNSIPGIRKVYDTLLFLLLYIHMLIIFFIQATNSDFPMSIQVGTTTSHRTDDISLNELKREVSEPKVS